MVVAYTRKVMGSASMLVVVSQRTALQCLKKATGNIHKVGSEEEAHIKHLLPCQVHPEMHTEIYFCTGMSPTSVRACAHHQLHLASHFLFVLNLTMHHVL
uniref:Uncharacterized protein n=1 Tax=Sphaerodactylus townsendi TaxID=933632 RepID=A0ACB8E9W0_9SAUR